MAKYAFSNIPVFSIDEDGEDIENMTLPSLSPILGTAQIPAVTASPAIAENAQRRAEEKFIVYEEMAFAKHKQLAEAMAKLAKAKEQLARLEAPTCADRNEVAGS
ncbi:hypothetical protein Fot_21972 [Forsythia ovata]|uniref:Uncharacterized protein n=1 Tax=Forsythia ovata TaxID=205694 RepID=A0ABD1UWR2_9LAMI